MTDIITPAAAPPLTMASIDLQGKTYQIKCQEHEVPALQKAADYLNRTLKSLPQGGRPPAPERLGIMAALNLASQLIELEEQMGQQMHFLNQRLHNLLTKLERALAPSDPSAGFRLEVESVQV